MILKTRRIGHTGNETFEVPVKKAFTHYDENFYYYKDCRGCFQIVHEHTGLGIANKPKLKDAKNIAYQLLDANCGSKESFYDFLADYQKQYDIENLIIN